MRYLRNILIIIITAFLPLILTQLFATCLENKRLVNELKKENAELKSYVSNLRELEVIE